MTNSRNLYLELLKKAITGLLNDEISIGGTNIGDFNGQNRKEGRDWPERSYSMVGIYRLDNIQFCIDQIIKDNIDGDFLEAGVWRGGAAMFMKGVLNTYAINNKNIWLADSFTGLPVPDLQNFPQDEGLNLHVFNELAVSVDEVRNNFERFGLLDDKVNFLKGWFKDVLPHAPVEKLSLLRVDGDLYESTYQALTYLYPKVTLGGFIIVDDYGDIESCRLAVDDYRRNNLIKDEIQNIDWTGIYWRKS